VTGEDWRDLVSAGNETWRSVLPHATARKWFEQLKQYETELVQTAVGDLANTCTSWPDLAQIREQIRYHLRQRGARDWDDHNDGPVVTRDEWLDHGAPGYPEGPDQARAVWGALFAVRDRGRATADTPVAELELGRPHLEVLEGGLPDDAPVDVEVLGEEIVDDLDAEIV
jgi:hypothetical protein